MKITDLSIHVLGTPEQHVSADPNRPAADPGSGTSARPRVIRA